MGCGQSTRVNQDGQQHSPGDNLPLRCIVTGKIFVNYDAAQQHANETHHTQFCPVHAAESAAKQAEVSTLASRIVPNHLVPAPAPDLTTNAERSAQNAPAPAPLGAVDTGLSTDEMMDVVDQSPLPPKKTDPLKHESGMYLRWDPSDNTAGVAQAAWDSFLAKYTTLPPMDPASGAPTQQMSMVDFDSRELPWEASDNVVPSYGARMTAGKLTNMLRGGGHISDSCRVAAVECVPLALQGVLSQTFKLVVTYEGTVQEGTPASFIAKFLNPDPSFAFYRFVIGSGGLRCFEIEDWMYKHDYIQNHGMRQPVCYFTSYPLLHAPCAARASSRWRIRPHAFFCSLRLRCPIAIYHTIRFAGGFAR